MIGALRWAALASCALTACNEIVDNRDFPGPQSDGGNPVVDCAATGRPATTLTGTVYAPNRMLALPISHALVYVPDGEVADIPDGPSGPACASHKPVASAFTDSLGKFRLANVPSGSDVTLVVQAGKWQRKIQLPSVAECSETAIDPEQTHLPRTRGEGHIPHIAISTGQDDALECLARDVGIDDSEIASPTGRVHLYAGNGTMQFAGGPAFEPRSALITGNALKTYDAVLVGCEGRGGTGDATGGAAMFDFVKAGGWLWLTHDEFTWIRNPPWPTLATFTPQQALPAPSALLIDKATSQGQAFAAWLDAFAAPEVPDTLDVELVLSSCHGADPVQTQRILYLDPAHNPAGDQMFTWDAGNGGRLVFSDVHLSGIPEQQTPPPYPQECMMPLVQELAIMYQLFDTPTCVP